MSGVLMRLEQCCHLSFRGASHEIGASWGKALVSLNESEMIDLAMAGDAKAFRELLDIHYMTIYRMAFRFCGNQHDAEDVTQLACIKVADQISSFRKQSAFTTWLYTLVLNTSRDWRRAQGRHRHDGLEGAEEVASSGATPEQALSARQQLDRVQALPDAEREVVLLVFGEGLSHKQAADILGCAESTVSWRIHEARKKLMNEGDRKHG